MARIARGVSLYQRDGSPFWYFHFTGPQGKREKGTTGKTDRAEANEIAQGRYAAAWTSHIASKEESTGTTITAKSATLGWAFERFFEHRTTVGVAVSTIAAYRTRQRAITKILPESTLLVEIGPPLVHKYVSARKGSAPIRGGKAQKGQSVALSTISSELGIVECLLTLSRSLLGEDSGIPSPTKAVPKEYRAIRPHRTLWLDQAQTSALLDYFRKGGPIKRKAYRERTSQADYDCLVGWLHTGCRSQELFRIRASHYRKADRLLFIDGTKTAKAKRWVPVSPLLAEVLDRRTEGLTPSAYVFPKMRPSCWDRDRLTPACKALGLPRITPVHLRHTFASILVDRGVSSRVIAECLGHSTTTLVEKVYGHLSIGSVGHIVTAALPR